MSPICRAFSYVHGDFRTPGHSGPFENWQPKTGVCSNIVFYLAIKPEDFGAVTGNLAAAGLNRPRGLHRIVVEKPFGVDLESAQALNQLMHHHFDEQQIYRIDHYLAKETVQNLLVFRFANLMISRCGAELLTTSRSRIRAGRHRKQPTLLQAARCAMYWQPPHQLLTWGMGRRRRAGGRTLQMRK